MGKLVLEVKIEDSMEGTIFAWHPPYGMKNSTFGRKLGASFRTELENHVG